MEKALAINFFLQRSFQITFQHAKIMQVISGPKAVAVLEKTTSMEFLSGYDLLCHKGAIESGLI